MRLGLADQTSVMREVKVSAFVDLRREAGMIQRIASRADSSVINCGHDPTPLLVDRPTPDPCPGDTAPKYTNPADHTSSLSGGNSLICDAFPRPEPNRGGHDACCRRR